ncbi:phage baseplate protein [Brevibacillus ginsengisoli]|uniref:phage baseplate protein n=1 Tax=Brevibacillus ginsengisoli TaxID=363854 RepID=UPI003CEC957E
MGLNPILDLTNPQISSLVYLKTNIGGWFFDAILRSTHTSRLNITQHPVQTGAAVTDHAFLQPKELTMEIGMSDVAKGLIPGQFTGGWSRSVQAFKVLQELQALRVPLQVHTRLGLYQNMLIEELSAPDDFTTLYALRCTVTLREIIVAQVRTVKVSSKPAVTDRAKRGKQEPQSANVSDLEQIRRKMSGG